jgi:hypothetical protein
MTNYPPLSEWLYRVIITGRVFDDEEINNEELVPSIYPEQGVQEDIDREMDSFFEEEE